MRPVSVNPEPDATLRVELHGELDIAHAEQILNEIQSAIDSFLPRTVRMDLSGVTFIDSTGLGTLVNSMKAAHEAGSGYELTHVPELVRSRLRRTGLWDVFGLADEGDPPS